MYVFCKYAGILSGRLMPRTKRHPRRAGFQPLGEALETRVSLSQIGPGETSHPVSLPADRSPAILLSQGSAVEVRNVGSENTATPQIKDQVNVQLDAMTMLSSSANTANPQIKDQVNVELGAVAANSTSGMLITSQIKDQLNIELVTLKVTVPDHSILAQGIQPATTALDPPESNQ